MRIGVNLIPLWPGKIGGMETYVRNLLKHVALIDKKNDYYLFTASWNNDTIDFPPFQNVLLGEEIEHYSAKVFANINNKFLNSHYLKLVIARWQNGFLNSRFSNPYKSWQRYRTGKKTRIFNSLSLDLWFCPLIYLEPRYLKMPTVITIPDVQQEHYPEFFTNEQYLERLVNWKRSCSLATKVLTISEFSKRDLCEKYYLKPEKVEVTLPSVADEFLNYDGIKDKVVINRYLLPEEFAYYPANTWPHKNHKLLIEGFALFKKKDKSNLKLVFSGVDDARANLEKLVKHFNLTNDVVFFSYLERGDLPAIYRIASFMIFPSLFEGFGIPLLEAFASDCPVAASNLASIPEVAADAAYYFDPTNPEDIAGAFKNMTSDSLLREKLVEKGRKRLRHFSWDKTAKQTIKIFEELYHG